MQQIDVNTAEQYLRDSHRIAQDESVDIRELAGGVSNVVLYVSCERGKDFVLKQARPKLRVPEPWFCSVERIWREVDVMKLCDQVVSDRLSDPDDGRLTIAIPQVLFEDRDGYAFAMTAAPRHEVWKAQLLSGRADPAIARACGELMGELHAGTWRDEAVAEQFSDRTFFVDLRIDPYYRHVATVHEELRSSIDRLIESIDANPLCLVHGDFSPKNLLVYDDGLMLVDFEVGHFGDPAFDLGFFMTHLVLKSFNAAPDHQPYVELVESFWRTYAATLAPHVSDYELAQLNGRAVQNLAGCILARIDGKSQIDYLEDSRRECVRGLGRQMMLDQQGDMDRALAEFSQHLTTL